MHLEMTSSICFFYSTCLRRRHRLSFHIAFFNRQCRRTISVVFPERLRIRLKMCCFLRINVGGTHSLRSYCASWIHMLIYLNFKTLKIDFSNFFKIRQDSSRLLLLKILLDRTDQLNSTCNSWKQFRKSRNWLSFNSWFYRRSRRTLVIHLDLPSSSTKLSCT